MKIKNIVLLGAVVLSALQAQAQFNYRSITVQEFLAFARGTRTEVSEASRWTPLNNFKPRDYFADTGANVDAMVTQKAVAGSTVSIYSVFTMTNEVAQTGRASLRIAVTGGDKTDRVVTALVRRAGFDEEIINSAVKVRGTDAHYLDISVTQGAREALKKVMALQDEVAKMEIQGTEAYLKKSGAAKPADDLNW